MNSGEVTSAPRDFNAFYRVEYPQLVALAYALTGNREAAETLAQDVFYAALRRWDRLGPTPGAARWVRTRAMRLADSRLARLPTSVRAWMRRPPPTFRLPRPDHEAVWSEVRRLPAAQRHAIALHHIDGLTVDEVATMLGEETDAVEARLRTGAQQVHKRLLRAGWSHREPIVETERLVLTAARRVVRPDITEVAASRRRLLRIAAGAAALIVLSAGFLAWRAGSTTPDDLNGVAAPGNGAAPEPYLLLDGGTISLSSRYDFALDSYSFSMTAPELSGERAAVIAPVAHLPRLAEAEMAVSDEQIDDGIEVWQAEREGRPVFMSIDLGDWVVWLHVGDYDNRPDDAALGAVAQRLFGAVARRGVVLLSTQPDDFELHLAAGDEQLLTVRVGICRRAQMPGSEVMAHPRRGEVIKTATYASWCDAAGGFEVVVEGPAVFVDAMIATLEIDRVRFDGAAQAD